MKAPDSVTFVTVDDIPALLRLARKSRSWPASRVAQDSGLSQAMVTLSETGKRVPHTPNLIALLDALGYDLKAVKR